MDAIFVISDPENPWVAIYWKKNFLGVARLSYRNAKLTIIVKQLQTGIAQVSEVETGSMIGTFLFGYPL